MKRTFFILFLVLLLAGIPAAFAQAPAAEPDVRTRTTGQMLEQMQIDDAYWEAKSVSVPQTQSDSLSTATVIDPVRTQQEILNAVIPADLKDAKIDLDFSNVPLGDIFMSLGKAGNINVMLDPMYKTQLADIHLKQVHITEAFTLLANAYDLGFKQIQGSLFVTSMNKIKGEHLVSQVFKLKYLRAEEAKDLIAEMADNIAFSPEINSLMISGTPDQINQIEKMLKHVDQPQPQVLLEAKIIEISDDASKDLGIDWSDQIALSAQEINRPVTFSDPETTSGRDIFQISSFQRSAIQLNATIKMLETQGKAKVLSNPRVMTLNEKEAEIFVGDRFPYEISSVTSGTVTTEVRFEEPGIRLTITPSIIEDDFVVIKVEPEVSFIFSFRGTNNNYPWTKKRTATAYVHVRNRQPFVIGGLLSQEDKNTIYKVPVLGNIPLLGNLFKYTDQNLLDTELIITVIPTIIRNAD